MDMSEKNYAEIRLLKIFFLTDDVLMEIKTLVKKHKCEIFNKQASKQFL